MAKSVAVPRIRDTREIKETDQFVIAGVVLRIVEGAVQARPKLAQWWNSRLILECRRNSKALSSLTARSGDLA
jgi:hypothetical protein